MIRHFAAVLVCVATAAPGAFAGINPASPGLPVASAFGTTYANNRASAMCVDCHTETPKPASGTHFVAHWTGAAMRTTNNKTLEKLDAWTIRTGVTEQSKYAFPAPPDPAAASVKGVVGEMICESCHNLVRNVDGGNNLLALARDDMDPSSLCLACHASQAAGPPNHHALTGDMVGRDDEVAGEHALSTAHASHVRAIPVAGSDVVYPAANAVNCTSCHNVHGAAEQTGARMLRRGYSASTNPLLSGKAVNVISYADTPVAGDVAGNIKAWDTGDAVTGIDRQYDVALVIGGAYRLVTEQTPLCDACHAP